MKNSNTSYVLFRLFIKAVTWSRDSHGLYDYESRNVQKKLIQTLSSCFLCRAGTDVLQVSDLSDARSEEERTPLCYIEQDHSEFSIRPHKDPLWMVIRTMKTKYGSGYILNEGDIVKLGRVCFKVATIRSRLEFNSSVNTQDSDDRDFDIPNERENSICRICLTDDSDSINPLISPCHCSGSMKYIHLGFLQQ